MKRRAHQPLLPLLLACIFLPLQPLHAAPDPAFVGSKSCRECHPKFYELWSTSFHGLALQPYSTQLATNQLTPHPTPLTIGTNQYQVDITNAVVLQLNTPTPRRLPITQAMGGKNIFYFLTPLDRGRLQVLPIAYDVRRQEWYDTAASAMRHFGSGIQDQPVDWTDPSLTFNTSCFTCHVSQLTNHYSLATDSYQTSWAEPGINCETCHGPSAEHAATFSRHPTNQPPPAQLGLISTRQLTPIQRDDMCAPCHARMSPITPHFSPGQRFFDHFDLVTLENRDFHPDGRDLGENYTYTRWRQNPCVKSGQLECIHCHTSSGRYRFNTPETANHACLPCHKARVESPESHTHHKPGKPGSRCIDCHMPMTEFARMRRSDHSLLPPTPAATLTFQSPNACNLCHTNKDPAWADARVREWHTRDYQQPILQKASLVAGARKADPAQLTNILDYLTRTNRDEILTTSLVRLLGNYPPTDNFWPPLRQLLADPSPLVRAATAEALGNRLDPTNTSALLASLSDDYRLVRIRTAAALAPLPPDRVPASHQKALQRATDEFLASMTSRPDDFASHYNLGNYHLAGQRLPEAVRSFETAAKLRPDAIPIHVNAALAYNALGQNNRAEASLRRALALEPTNAVANLNLGLLLAELNQLPAAEKALRAAFQSDPRSAQAAYNLGILLASSQPAEAIHWSRIAAELRPDNPQYGYTHAFYLHQAGRNPEALAAIRKVLQRHPNHPDSRLLEQALRAGQ